MSIEITSTDIQSRLDACSSSSEQVRIAAEYALRELQATTETAKRSSGDIAKLLASRGVKLRIAESSFAPYLSSVVNSDQTAIVSGGRGKSGGYYLSSAVQELIESAQPDAEIEQGRTYTKYEESLYPVFRQWLIGQGYSGKTTGSMRGLGKWSNPDVTGIRVSEHLGRVEIEIATIEVKKDLADWERVFFEAVSHRRYATRAYFAYPVPEEAKSKVPEDMRYYSELYNVGVLILVMTDSDYHSYQSGQLHDLDYEPADVIEVLSARSAPVPLGQQRRFCEAIEIKDLQSLLRWGD